MANTKDVEQPSISSAELLEREIEHTRIDIHQSGRQHDEAFHALLRADVEGNAQEMARCAHELSRIDAETKQLEAALVALLNRREELQGYSKTRLHISDEVNLPSAEAAFNAAKDNLDTVRTRVVNLAPELVELALEWTEAAKAVDDAGCKVNWMRQRLNLEQVSVPSASWDSIIIFSRGDNFWDKHETTLAQLLLALVTTGPRINRRSRKALSRIHDYAHLVKRG